MMFLRSLARFLKLFPQLLEKKAHISPITHGKFYSWKAFRLEDVNEDLSGYGNHNQAYTVRYRQLQYTK